MPPTFNVVVAMCAVAGAVDDDPAPPLESRGGTLMVDGAISVSVERVLYTERRF